MISTMTWKRTTIISLAVLLLCANVAHSNLAAPPPNLPKPKLFFAGKEIYQAGGNTWVRYKLKVANWAVYPGNLFAPAPNLPACGNNAQASRTWVDIFDRVTGKRIYGFCALGSPQDLTKLWFAVKKGEKPPSHVYIVMRDRRLNQTYVSNSVAIP